MKISEIKTQIRNIECTRHKIELEVKPYCPECEKEYKESIPIVPPVKPACGHKRTAKQFFIEQYQEGKCKDITTNPYPEFNNAFYLNIYKLMEDYSKSV